MSSSASTPQDRTRATYPRENWWGTQYEEEPEPNQEPEYPGVSYARYIAKGILADGCERLCPKQLLEDPGEDELALHDEQAAIVLDDEEQHWVTDESYQLLTSAGLYPRRVNPRTGYLSGSGPIRDRPRAEFMEYVEDFLAWTSRNRGLREDDRELLRRLAFSEKSQPDGPHDVDIVETLVTAIDYPNGVQEYLEDHK